MSKGKSTRFFSFAGLEHVLRATQSFRMDEKDGPVVRRLGRFALVISIGRGGLLNGKEQPRIGNSDANWQVAILTSRCIQSIWVRMETSTPPPESQRESISRLVGCGGLRSGFLMK